MCNFYISLYFLQIILDQKLSLFTSDKFLSGASGPALKSLCLVGEKVLLHYPDEPNEKWLKAISMALTHSESATRSFANFATKRLGNTLGGLETLKQLGNQLCLFIWQNLDSDPELCGDLKVGNVKMAVGSLCKAVSSDGTLTMAQILLPICYHPAVLASDGELWIRSCQKLKVDLSE